MRKYLVKRLLLSVVILFFVTFIIYLINLMSDAVLLIIVSICRFFIGCVVCSRISIDCSLNQFLRLADTVCNLTLNLHVRKVPGY